MDKQFEPIDDQDDSEIGEYRELQKTKIEGFLKVATLLAVRNEGLDGDDINIHHYAKIPVAFPDQNKIMSVPGNETYNADERKVSGTEIVFADFEGDIGLQVRIVIFDESNPVEAVTTYSRFNDSKLASLGYVEFRFAKAQTQDELRAKVEEEASFNMLMPIEKILESKPPAKQFYQPGEFVANLHNPRFIYHPYAGNPEKEYFSHKDLRGKDSILRSEAIKDLLKKYDIADSFSISSDYDWDNVSLHEKKSGSKILENLAELLKQKLQG